MEQTAKNACGSVGLFHILMNLDSTYDKYIEKDSILFKTKEHFKGKSSKERADIFKNSMSIKNTHKEATQEGQTKTDEKDDVNNHFVAFIWKEGSVYEMDGQKSFPINHGECTQDEFLNKTCEVLKEFI